MSQTELAKKTGINRSILSRLEAMDYTPSVNQLLALSSVLGFDPADVIIREEKTVETERKHIVVAGIGYVGLSLAVLLSQYNDVTAVDVIPEKTEMINSWRSPIRDE